MKKTTLSLVAATFTLAAWGATTIGSVQATGEFRLNQATTRGTGTLFDGSSVETGSSRSDVSLSSGGHIALAPNSKTKVFATRAVLESGAAEMSGRNFTLIAAKLSVTGSSAQVAVDSPSKIRVAALTTPVEVRNSSNMLIALVAPGTTLAFENGGAPADGSVSVTGLVTKEGTTYYITDKTTNVKYQLQGVCADLEKYAGKSKSAKVDGSLVSGVAPSGGATAVVALSPKNCVVAGAAVAGAAGAAGAGAGLSSAAIGGIVVAGAVGGIVGGLAAAGTFSDASGK